MLFRSIPHQGYFEARVKRSEHEIFSRVNERVFEVPTAIDGAAFLIQQDCNLKTISVKLSDTASAWWQSNNYFQLSHVFLVACRPHDPHLLLWRHDIPAEQLNTEYKFVYTGEDVITFYTRKIFNSYGHELLS